MVDMIPRSAAALSRDIDVIVPYIYGLSGHARIRLELEK
jgi:hypothetical protein